MAGQEGCRSQELALGSAPRTRVPDTPPTQIGLPKFDAGRSDKLPATLIIAALFTGGFAGLLGGVFRIVLRVAERIRYQSLAWAHQDPAWGWLVPVLGLAVAAGSARWLVRRFAPEATGSGIPRVEAVVRDNAALSPLVVLPVKFVGGALGLGAGLALGREGPTVQMGAMAGQFIGRVFRLPLSGLRTLVAAGAGAGLASAFSAPLSGAVFVLEEIVQRFNLRVAVATLSACSASIAVTYQLLGTRPSFSVPPLAIPGFFHFLFYLSLGVPLGALGAAYNWLVVRGLDVTDRFSGMRSDLAAAAIGGVIGLVGWFLPSLLGGGDLLVQRLVDGRVPLLGLSVLLVARFALGPLSYAAQTPGGLFAPLLVVGGALGTACGIGVHAIAPEQLRDPAALTLVGMAGFFAATVRAPVTGITLIVELTGVSSLFVPLLATCSVAALVPTLLGNAPIYDTLGQRARRLSGPLEPPNLSADATPRESSPGTT
jgi:chloride channel protein, CIC family